MKQNIQELLSEIVELSIIRDSTISSEAKGALYDMQKLFRELTLSSNEQHKQEKMIKIFIGGVITALSSDDRKYRHSPKLYPRNTLRNAELKLPEGNLTAFDYLYTVGNEAFSELPQSFCGELFKIKSDIINTVGLAPFSPKLEANANKIDQLVKFCLDHTDNLESDDLVDEVDSPYHFSQNFVDEFVKLHKQSYHSGFFGGFFNRTNLKQYDSLTSQDILEHAKKGTFFGSKNRTCKILEEMHVIDVEGNLLQQTVNNNLFN